MMKLSERGPITQVRLLFDGEGGIETVNVNAEVVQLEGENERLPAYINEEVGIEHVPEEFGGEA